VCLGPDYGCLNANARRDGDFNIIGYDAIPLDGAKADAAYVILVNATAPALSEMLVPALVKARMMCKRRAEDTYSEEALQAAYLEIFQQWPGDVAMKVISGIPRLEGGWWPCANAVEQELKFTANGRLELRKALEIARHRPRECQE